VEPTFNAIDSRGFKQDPETGGAPTIPLNPAKDSSFHLAMYFVAAIVVTAFFAFPVFVATVVDYYNHYRREFEGWLFLTDDEKRMHSAQLVLKTVSLHVRPDKPPGNKWTPRKLCYRLVKQEWFDSAMLFFIVCDVISMGAYHYAQSSETDTVLDRLYNVFFGLYSLEAILRIGAFGFADYWSSSHMNQFDFCLITGQWVIEIFWWAGAIESFEVVNAARSIQALRLIRLVRVIDSLGTIFLTLWLSAKSLVAVGLLIFVLLFVFAILVSRSSLRWCF
jgi:hypothetical protein